jgi:hypothetical protein
MIETLGPPDCGGGPFTIFRCTGEIILAGERIQWAYFSIDFLDPAAQNRVDAVEIEVALEDPVPPCL